MEKRPNRGLRGLQGKQGKKGDPGEPGKPGNNLNPQVLIDISTKLGELGGKMDSMNQRCEQTCNRINNVTVDVASHGNQIEVNTTRLNHLDNIETGVVPRIEKEIESIQTNQKWYHAIAAFVGAAMATLVRFILKASGV
jgi:hypothetical protein